MIGPQNPAGDIPRCRGRPDRIALLVSDVDGALVTPEKVLTPRAATAVRVTS